MTHRFSFASRVSLVLLGLACCTELNLTTARAQRDLRDIPEPNPKAEREAMRVADGFEVNLFASDPMFAKPIHMNFDEQGRLWIASSRNYPQIEPGAEPTDQVVIVEDRNRDGVADHHTVFADNLLIPTGVLPGDGGVYVANSTELIHLSDTDGDGRADKRKTILSGFGTEDTHHLVHTLRWAPDGWMHFNQSIYIHSHIETPRGIKHLDGGGIWRFDPGSYDLQVFCKGFVNPWGHAIDAFGQSLATDGAYFEGINYVFPEAVFVTSPGATRWLAGLNPGSPKHCGLEIISGGAMPAEFQGHMVTNDFRSHRVCVFDVDRQGSGYRSAQLPELIRTEHVAFRPIDVKMGPDGAIYVADWYNPIIQHGEVDFRDPRRDTSHGRIWRITAKGKQPLVPPKYDQLKEGSLCELLRDSALWVRQFARMELARRQRSKRESALDSFVSSARDANEKSLRQMERLWVKLCAREIDEKLIDELHRDDDPRIRAMAVRTISRLRDQLPNSTTWLTASLSDVDDQVVLEAVSAVGQIKSVAAVEQLLSVANRPNQDQFLKFALWNAVRSTEPVWLEALENNQLPNVKNDLAKLRLLADAATQSAVAKPLLDLLREGQTAESVTSSVVELVADKAGPSQLAELLEWLTSASNKSSRAARTSYLQALARIALSRNVKPDRIDALLPSAMESALSKLQETPATAGDEQVEYMAQLADLAGQWQSQACIPVLNRWLDTLSKSDANTPDNSNTSSAQTVNVELTASPMARAQLALARMPNEDARRAVRARANDTKRSPQQRATALMALALFDANQAAEGTLQFLAAIEPADLPTGEALVTSLVSRSGGLDALRKALPKLGDTQWKGDGARVLLATVRNAPGIDDALLSEIMAATRFDSLGWKWSDEWSAGIIAKAMNAGDAARGEAIYRQARLQCVRCHAIGPAGGNIGPNLVSLGGSSPPEYILQSLIDPNAKLKEGFQTLSVLTEDGRVISGLQKARTQTQLNLVLADGTEEKLSLDAVESIKPGRSLMPAGLVDILKEQELVDLTRFLIELGKTPKYTVDTAPRVRNWQALEVTPASTQLLNRTSLDSAAGDNKDLRWLPVTTTVSGRLPLNELPQFKVRRELPPLTFVRFDIECKQAGSVRFEFTSPAESMSLWVDGRPRPVPAADEVVQFTAGSHRIVLGLVIRDVGPSFGCQVQTGHVGSAVVDLPGNSTAAAVKKGD